MAWRRLQVMYDFVDWNGAATSGLGAYKFAAIKREQLAAD
jgi:hypothetical protein